MNKNKQEMKQFIGVKIIHAEPAKATENDKRGTYPTGAEGYKVVYEDGYTSWSPKAVFDAAYRPTDGLTFGLAIEALKLGKKVARVGWDCKSMWLHYVDGVHYGVSSNVLEPVAKYGDPEISLFPTLAPWIGMKTADNNFVPWLASQTDVLADDWMIV